MVWGCVSAHATGDIRIIVRVPLMQRLLLEFWRDMLSSRQRLFPGTPCLFQQDNARFHSDEISFNLYLLVIC